MSSEKELKVSVCVITYNHGEWLRECLQSIVEQKTDFVFEVIVGDDCSTDNITIQILHEFSRKYPELVVPILREKNLGDYGTQNYLDVMRRAKGKYIANVDGDDRTLPGKLQKQADFLDENPECAIVAHNLRIFQSYTGETITEKFYGKDIPSITDINFLLLHRCFFGHCSKMFRSNALITTHTDFPTLDFFFHIEHALSGNIGYINETLGEYRKFRNTSNFVTSNDYHIRIKAYHKAYERAIELGCDKNIVLQGKNGFNFEIALSYLLCDQYNLFREYIYIDKKSWNYTSNIHKILHILRGQPVFLHKTLSLLRIIKKGIVSKYYNATSVRA